MFLYCTSTFVTFVPHETKHKNKNVLLLFSRFLFYKDAFVGFSLEASPLTAPEYPMAGGFHLGLSGGRSEPGPEPPGDRVIIDFRLPKFLPDRLKEAAARLKLKDRSIKVVCSMM